MPQNKVLLWTENYRVGGCDRYLTDLYHSVDHTAWSLQFAGNVNPLMDRFLIAQGITERRTTIPVHSIPRLMNKLPISRPPLRSTASEGLNSPAGRSRHGRESLVQRLQKTLRAAVSACAVLVRLLYAAANYHAQIRLLKRMRPDVVFINNGGYPAAESCLTMAAAAHHVGIRRIIHVVHNIPKEREWPISIERRIDNHLAHTTHAWITASDFTSDLLVERRGVPRERVHTVRHGLPAIEVPDRTARQARREHSAFSPNDIVVSVIALFEQRKGHDVFIRALSQLPQGASAPRFKILLVGDGPTRTVIQQQVREAGLAAVVTFTGWVDDIDAVLDATDILALPSVGDECLPYAILHAMQHALPVVASRVAGIPEQVIDGSTGYLTEPGDAEALRDALLKLSSPTTRAAMGQRGWDRLRDEFDPTQTVSKVAALWSQTGV